MRKFYAIAAFALCASTATAQVSTAKANYLKKTHKTTLAQKPSASKFSKSFVVKKKAADARSIWKPAHEDLYTYEEGEWALYAGTDLTYDKKGNLLSETINEAGDLTRNSYVYNDNNFVTSKVVEYGTEDEPDVWTQSEKTTYTYDGVVANIQTSKMEYIWDDVQSDWADGSKQSQKRIITRDAQGRVTSVERTTYFSYTDSWGVAMRTDITYDEVSGQASSIAIRHMAGYDDDKQILLSDPEILKDIEWENTDGQIICENFAELLYGNNRIKKANIYEVNGEEEILVSSAEVQYTAGKADYVYTETFADEPGKVVNTYNETDAYGSYTLREDEYFDDEGEEYISYLTKFGVDALGNIVLDEAYSDEGIGEFELIYGQRANCSYDDETGALLERVVEEFAQGWDEETEEPLPGQYSLFEKYVYSGISDVTVTSIKSATGNANAPTAVYNLQGISAGTSTDNLPAGMYIVKKGNEVYKMTKK